MKFWVLLGILGLGLGRVAAQSIVIDPVTKTIRVVDENGEELTGTNSVADEENSEGNSAENSDADENPDVEENLENSEDENSEENSGEESSETDDSDEVVDENSDAEENLENVENSEEEISENLESSEENSEDENTVAENSAFLTGNPDSFVEALDWMAVEGLTRYDSAEEFRPDDAVTREEAAKFFAVAAELWGAKALADEAVCVFEDANLFDESLRNSIQEACELGILRGAQGKFLPRENLTKAQAAAILLRIFEGEMTDESFTPWWFGYFVKAREIGLTKDVAGNFGNEITRREVAIFLWRMQLIVADGTKSVINRNLLNSLELEQNSGKNETGENLVDTGPVTVVQVIDPVALASVVDFGQDAEFVEALEWLEDIGFSDFDTAESFRPFGLMTREDLAGFLARFAEEYLADREPVVEPERCVFADIAASSEQNAIQKICALGVLLGSQGNFQPKKVVSKAEFVVALVRLLEGRQLDESGEPRWGEYFALAFDLGIVEAEDAISFEKDLTRYEAAIFLYRFKTKFLLLEQSNATTVQGEFFRTLNSETGADGSIEGEVWINTIFLENPQSELGFVDLLGTRYRAMKTRQENFAGNNFAWYGSLRSLEGEQVGSVMVLVSNGSVVESVLRIGEASRQVRPSDGGRLALREL